MYGQDCSLPIAVKLHDEVEIVRSAGMEIIFVRPFLFSCDSAPHYHPAQRDDRRDTADDVDFLL